MKNNFYEVSITKRDTLYPKKIVDMVDMCLGEVMSKTPSEIEKMANPEPIMYEIRDAFWRELEVSEDEKRKINMDNVVHGIMPLPMFMSYLKRNRYLSAWLVMPIVIYEKRIKSMLDSATKRYEEILTMPLKTKKVKKLKVNGEDEIVEWEEYDMNRVNTWLKLMTQLENRVHGNSIQKQLVVTASEPSASGSSSLNIEEVDKKLKELEDKMHGSTLEVNLNEI